MPAGSQRSATTAEITKGVISMKQNRLFVLLSLILLFIPAVSPSVQADEPVGQIGEARFTHAGDATVSYVGCAEGEIASVVDATFEQRVVELVNIERAKLNPPSPPMKGVEQLYRSARYHATDMGEDDYVSHDTHDLIGDTAAPLINPSCGFSDRIEAYGYNFITSAENIAAGLTLPENVMAKWLNSSGHRSNIENELLWEIGVGYYRGSGSIQPYWVQNFGRRANIYPVIINREAIETSSPNVSLYIYGDWKQIRFRNDNEAWSNWQPFTSATVSWTLANQTGERLVTVEMENDAGSTYRYSDTINLISTDENTSTPTPIASYTVTPTPAASYTVTPTPVGGVYLPDLTISFVSLQLQGGNSCYTNPLGVIYEARIVIQNIGNADAGAFVVESGDTQQTISSLSAGASITIAMPLDDNPQVDVTNQVAESNETNNTYTEYILTPTSLPTCTPPAGRPTANVGDTATPTTTPTSTPTTTPTTTPIPSSTPTLFPSTPGTRPTIDSGGPVSGVVNLQSRSDYANTEIRLSESSCTANPPDSTLTTLTNSDGSFTITPPMGQNYQCLYVINDNFLSARQSIPRGDLGTINLLVGDLNQDNIIDILDVAYVGLRYDSTDLTADINQDGKVNIFDVSIVSGNYKKTGPLTNWGG